MNQKVFVFRVSKGHEGGSPKGHCPLDYSNVKQRIKKLTRDEITPIDYDGCEKFVQEQLWNQNILRQGWGLEDLDLVLDTKVWIENYMFNGKRFWDANISCDLAKGRLNILRRMLDIRINDIIILPKTSESNIDDYHRFSVCQLDSEYYFDSNNEYSDFGHCLKVKNLKSFGYNKDTLLSGDFGSPYLWAITEVREYHSRYSRFIDFLEKNYIM
ncbi:MAG: hypothetical protein WCR42_16015 [bacterium]